MNMRLVVSVKLQNNMQLHGKKKKKETLNVMKTAVIHHKICPWKFRICHHLLHFIRANESEIEFRKDSYRSIGSEDIIQEGSDARVSGTRGVNLKSSYLSSLCILLQFWNSQFP